MENQTEELPLDQGRSMTLATLRKRRFEEREPGRYLPVESQFEDADKESRCRHMAMLVKQRGSRYAPSTFRNYVATCPAQTAAVAKIQNYLSELDDNLAGGNSLVVYGAVGTGKDHLIMAAMGYAVMKHGVAVVWRNGMDIFANIRKAFSENESDHQLILDLVRPELLVLSDPLPPSGELAEFRQEAMFRIIDARYSNNRATWVTVNVKDSKEMEARLGIATTDRLRDGATAIHCNWQSYRKPA